MNEPEIDYATYDSAWLRSFNYNWIGGFSDKNGAYIYWMADDTKKRFFVRSEYAAVQAIRKYVASYMKEHDKRKLCRITHPNGHFSFVRYGRGFGYALTFRPTARFSEPCYLRWMPNCLTWEVKIGQSGWCPGVKVRKYRCKTLKQVWAWVLEQPFK